MDKNITPSQNAKYSDLFERLLDSVFLLDSKTYQVLDANSASERLLGIDRGNIIGHSVSEWIPDSELDGFEKALRIASRRYHPYRLELKWKGHTGKLLHVELVICSLKLMDDGAAIQVIAKDITLQVEVLKRLEELSITDEMTKLPNFRHFMRSLESEHERACRYGNPYSIIFSDVDNFKHYNDTNGHPAGDALLKQLGTLFKETCRTVDLPARYGGEEFAILCPETDEVGAVVLAERLRLAVGSFPFEHASSQPLGKVTISIGVAGFLSRGEKAAEILKRADEAVYHSKKSGRNRVTSSLDLKNMEFKRVA